MKKFNITNGKAIFTGINSNPETTYGEFDADTFMVHLSETELTDKADVIAIGTLLEKAADGKLITSVKQRSRNCIGFSITDESDAALRDKGVQDARNHIKAEAKRFSDAIKAAQSSSGSKQSGQSGTQQQNGSNQGQKQQSQSGQSSNGSNQGQKQQSQSGQSSNDSKQQNGSQQSGTQQQNGSNQGQKQQSQQSQSKQFDKTKDAFGRPLKEAYPGLFWAGMTPAEEEAACDKYWAMIRHVDKDIFGK